ncbi:MAG: 3-glucosyltransferase [Verrucomicrobia bacterium]|nr:MAG: 3-glucosyltransferase [Verrucomicrobiota bacterium]
MMEAAKHLYGSCEVSLLAKSFPRPGQLPGGVQFLPLGGISLPLGIGLQQEKKRTQKIVDSRHWDVVAGFGVQAPQDSVVWVQSVHAAWWERARSSRKGWRRLLQGLNPFHRIVLGMEEDFFRQRRFRRLIALTPDVRADLQRYYGVEPGVVDVLPNGFGATEFHTGLQGLHRSTLRHLLRIPEEAWVVLFVANEWERKGLLPLLEAMALFKEKGAHMVVAGCLPRAFIENHAARLGLQGRVHVVGPTGRVNRWFGIADAFALPTAYEAWGMVIIEALAAGLPALTTRSAGAAVAIREGCSGYLLEDPFDVREISVGLQKLRRGVEWKAKEISESVSEYEWAKILQVYERILRATARNR